jgi:hypothetical protein
MIIEINPKTLNQDYPKSEGVPGVYIWGYFETDGKFIPLYVGKSRNVFERLIQHYCRFKAGEYSIFNRQHLIDKYCYNQKTIPKKIYEPTDFRKVFGLSLNTDHSYMIDNFIFRYTEITEEEFRKQAECYLADTVGREYLITSVSKGNFGSLSEQTKSILKDMAKSLV